MLWNSYRNNLDLIDLQRQNREIALRNLEIAMDRYKLGNLSGFDMRQVEKNLLDAEERVLEVEYDAKLCENRCDGVKMGRERRNIQENEKKTCKKFARFKKKSYLCTRK